MPRTVFYPGIIHIKKKENINAVLAAAKLNWPITNTLARIKPVKILSIVFVRAAETIRKRRVNSNDLVLRKMPPNYEQ